jgi:5-methylcytosine-specific restriction endonuclease McrA
MARNTGPSQEQRAEVYGRSGGKCERCENRTFDMAVHHRLPRRAGGTRNPVINDPANLVLLCRACHDETESHRGNAYLYGWLLHANDDPREIPAGVYRPETIDREDYTP